MSVKIVPISEYDFTMFSHMALEQFGKVIDVMDYSVNFTDSENPKCRNCGYILRYSEGHFRPKYCSNCGCKATWPTNN